MDSATHYFNNLDTLIDQVHALFEAWEEDTLPEGVVMSSLYQLKLAVHEWVANLVQHAAFSMPETKVSLMVWPKDGGLQCAIEDNSEGFALDSHLNIEPEYLELLPERGMGLLILKMCTEDLSYHRNANTQNRLEFYVSADEDPWPGIPS